MRPLLIGLFCALLGGCASGPGNVYENVTFGGIALVDVAGTYSQPPIGGLPYESLGDWTLGSGLWYALGDDSNRFATCDISALTSLLPGRLVDLTGTELTEGQTFTGDATIVSGSETNATLTYVVDHFEKPQPGSGDTWTSPPFLSLLVSGDIPDGTIAATLELGLSKYSDHCCQGWE